jgi:hypothetical protein
MKERKHDPLLPHLDGRRQDRASITVVGLEVRGEGGGRVPPRMCGGSGPIREGGVTAVPHGGRVGIVVVEGAEGGAWELIGAVVDEGGHDWGGGFRCGHVGPNPNNDEPILMGDQCLTKQFSSPTKQITSIFFPQRKKKPSVEY